MWVSHWEEVAGGLKLIVSPENYPAGAAYQQPETARSRRTQNGPPRTTKHSFVAARPVPVGRWHFQTLARDDAPVREGLRRSWRWKDALMRGHEADDLRRWSLYSSATAFRDSNVMTQILRGILFIWCWTTVIQRPGISLESLRHHSPWSS
jgi:hypothetical protein